MSPLGLYRYVFAYQLGVEAYKRNLTSKFLNKNKQELTTFQRVAFCAGYADQKGMRNGKRNLHRT